MATQKTFPAMTSESQQQLVMTKLKHHVTTITKVDSTKSKNARQHKCVGDTGGDTGGPESLNAVDSLSVQHVTNAKHWTSTLILKPACTPHFANEMVNVCVDT